VLQCNALLTEGQQGEREGREVHSEGTRWAEQQRAGNSVKERQRAKMRAETRQETKDKETTSPGKGPASASPCFDGTSGPVDHAGSRTSPYRLL
jgi:hypothetical protein